MDYLFSKEVRKRNNFIGVSILDKNGDAYFDTEDGPELPFSIPSLDEYLKEIMMGHAIITDNVYLLANGFNKITNGFCYITLVKKYRKTFNRKFNVLKKKRPYNTGSKVVELDDLIKTTIVNITQNQQHTHVFVIGTKELLYELKPILSSLVVIKVDAVSESTGAPNEGFDVHTKGWTIKNVPAILPTEAKEDLRVVTHTENNMKLISKKEKVKVSGYVPAYEIINIML